jgi:hypothetical protein
VTVRAPSVTGMNEHDARNYHALVMIEAAQRAGRTEDEIVAMVERYLGPLPGRPSREERGRIRRLTRLVGLARAA